MLLKNMIKVKTNEIIKIYEGSSSRLIYSGNSNIPNSLLLSDVIEMNLRGNCIIVYVNN